MGSGGGGDSETLNVILSGECQGPGENGAGKCAQQDAPQQQATPPAVHESGKRGKHHDGRNKHERRILDRHTERHNQCGDDARRDGGARGATDDDPGGKGQQEDRQSRRKWRSGLGTRWIVSCRIMRPRKGLPVR